MKGVEAGVRGIRGACMHGDDPDHAFIHGDDPDHALHACMHDSWGAREALMTGNAFVAGMHTYPLMHALGGRDQVAKEVGQVCRGPSW